MRLFRRTVVADVVEQTTEVYTINPNINKFLSPKLPTSVTSICVWFDNTIVLSWSHNTLFCTVVFNAQNCSKPRDAKPCRTKLSMRHLYRTMMHVRFCVSRMLDRGKNVSNSWCLTGILRSNNGVCYMLFNTKCSYYSDIEPLFWCHNSSLSPCKHLSKLRSFSALHRNGDSGDCRCSHISCLLSNTSHINFMSYKVCFWRTSGQK